MENYKGYIIEKEQEPWAIKFGQNYIFYPESGIDCSCEDGEWKSNVHGAKSIEDAKNEIDELTFDEKA